MSIADGANALARLATEVPTDASGSLCDDLERLRDQIVDILGTESELSAHADTLAKHSADVLRELHRLRSSITNTAGYHGGNSVQGGAPSSSRDTPRKPERKKKAPTLPPTVAEERGKVESFHSFSAAKRALGSRPGHELHHIVEQCQASEKRSGFPRDQINRTDNLIWIPVPVHRAISNEYSSKVPFTGKTLRDVLDGVPYEKQHSRGLESIHRALMNRGPRDE